MDGYAALHLVPGSQLTQVAIPSVYAVCPLPSGSFAHEDSILGPIARLTNLRSLYLNTVVDPDMCTIETRRRTQRHWLTSAPSPA